MNVLDFFELTSEPFANSPDGRFYFESAQHAQAMAKLRYVVDSMRGLALVIGDIGAGKTTLARRFMETLPDEEYEAALLVVIHSAITSDWLLTKIALQFGVEEPASEKVALLGQLYQRLREIHDAGRRAVVLIDEAQMLASREIMEELRGLLNLEIPGRKLVSLIFFGLPEVEEGLKLDPPLRQRVALKVHLRALPPASTEEYIKHRLRIAGARTMFFSREAVGAVHHYSSGIPRLINTICDNAMLEAYLLKRRVIDRDIVGGVARDLGLVGSEVPEPSPAAAGRPGASRDPLDPRLGFTQRPTPAAPLPPPAGGLPPRPGVPPAQARPASEGLSAPARGRFPAAAPSPSRPAAAGAQAGRPPGHSALPGSAGDPRRPAPPPVPSAPLSAPAAGPAGTPTEKRPVDELDEFDDLLASLEKP